MTLLAWNLDRSIYLDSRGCQQNILLFLPHFGKKRWFDYFSITEYVEMR